MLHTAGASSGQCIGKYTQRAMLADCDVQLNGNVLLLVCSLFGGDVGNGESNRDRDSDDDGDGKLLLVGEDRSTRS